MSTDSTPTAWSPTCIADPSVIHCKGGEKSVKSQRFIAKDETEIGNEFFLLNIPSHSEEHYLYCSNRPDNRYSDVLPSQKGLITLCNPPEGEDGYINANLLSLQNRSYIATQAPMIQTMAKFWQMVYEQRCETIVMLTEVSNPMSLLTQGVSKAERYWPKEIDGVERYGRFTVTLLEEVPFAFEPKIVMRKLSLAVEGLDMPPHLVTQWQDASWPDSGVPSSCDIFHRFLKAVRREESSKTSPILIHCSAGIGRSGTYIAADHLLHQTWNGLTENRDLIRDLVNEMRQSRSGLVQTHSQYSFLYTLLNQLIAIRAQD